MSPLLAVISQQADHSVRLDYKHMIEKALINSKGQSTHADLAKGIDELIYTKQLIPLDEERRFFVTPNMLKTEQQLRSAIDAGQEQLKPIALKSKLCDRLAGSTTQRACVANLLSQTHRYTLLNMRGRDTADLLNLLVDTLDNHGKDVSVITPSSIAAKEVDKAINRQSVGLRGWLKSIGREGLGQSIRGFNFKIERMLDNGRTHFPNHQQVWIVDNSNQMPVAELNRLTANAVGAKARVIFLNQSQYEKRFGAHNPVAVLKEGQVATVNYQSQPVQSTRPIRITEVSNDQDRIVQVARAFAKRAPGLRQHTALLVMNSKDKVAMNRCVRTELQSMGQLGQDALTLSVLKPVYLTEAEKTKTQAYAPGFIIKHYDKKGNVTQHEVVQGCKHRPALEVRTPHAKTLPTVVPLNSIREAAVFKRENLAIAVDDCLKASASMKSLGIQTGQTLKVVKINDQGVVFDIDGRLKKVRTKDLDQLSLDYHYSHSLNEKNLSRVKSVIAMGKSYCFDKPTIEQLTAMAPNQVTIVTDDHGALQKKME